MYANLINFEMIIACVVQKPPSLMAVFFSKSSNSIGTFVINALKLLDDLILMDVF